MSLKTRMRQVEQRPRPHDIQQKIPIFVENERSIESLIPDRIDWIDQATVRNVITHVDVSGITRKEINMDQAGDKLLEMMFRTANGRLTAAEALGHREFVLTRLYQSA